LRLEQIQRLLIAPLPNQNLGFQRAKSPVPFRRGVGKRAELQIRLLKSVLPFSALQLEPGVPIYLIRGDGWRALACGACKRDCGEEKSYGQGLPLTVAWAATTVPLEGEPISRRSIVSVRLPCRASISAT